MVAQEPNIGARLARRKGERGEILTDGTSLTRLT